MAESSTAQSDGGNIVGLIGVAFIVLKLTNHITWPWLWVLAPFWMGLAIIASVLVLLGGAWIVIRVIEVAVARKRRAARDKMRINR